jgi:CheY-like chemotaxis protein
VVDDEPDVCQLLTALLEGVDGYDVYTAHGAGEALHAIERQDQPFDALLLDIQMSGMTGVDLCSVIRTTPGYADVPVIMLTAMTEQRFLHDAFAAGANDYITKPFELADIRKAFAKQRTTRLRRARLKAGSGREPVEQAHPAREVIRAQEDAVSVCGVERCVTREAFQAYVLQSCIRHEAPLSARAIKIASVYDHFSRLPGGVYQDMIRNIAGIIAALTAPSADVFTHFGNGMFLSACIGNSALNESALNARLAKSREFDMLADHDLSLRVILGSEIPLSGATRAEIVLSLRDAIVSAEEAEEALVGWGTYREWFSQRRSVGAEHARMEKAAYEEVLDEFLEQGELGWNERRKA